MPNLTKTSLCRDLLTTGSCTRPDCLFAHNVEELRATNEFYKTSMCSFFRVGQCKLGDACRHAHDPAELVDMPKKEAFTTDDAEMSQTVSSGRVGRRGGRKARDKLNKPVQKDLEEDDELDTGSVFERVTTSPATFMWTPQSPNSHGTSTPESISTATGSTVADEADEDPFDDVQDMWARMKTMPAPSAMVPMTGLMPNELQALPMSAAGLTQMPMGCQNGVMMQQVTSPLPGAKVDPGPAVMMVPMQMPMVFVQMPAVQPSTPIQKGGYVDTSAFVRQISGTMSVSNEMEAKLLESAMPEVYED